MSTDQENQLQHILRDIHSCVATSVSEMRHCSQDLIQHILHSKPDAKWQQWRRRNQFLEKEMIFIRCYCSELYLLSPKISLIDEANQISPVTLALKHNRPYRMYIGYIYLNS
jgi:hypothetical protein